VPLGHIGLNVADLATAKGYFDQVMPLLGYEEFFSTDDQFSYRPVDGKPGTFVFFYAAPESGDYSRQRPGLQHLAFIVPTQSAVDDVHKRVNQLGDEVVHAPQEFPQYHPGYYASFWVDPFGHLLEVVCHGNVTI
jgi:catechol 2,3-dioxygenase-like lactoylglutathione lyase family enzyme